MEELGQLHRRAGGGFGLLQVADDRRVEAGHAGQVVAGPPEDQLSDLDESPVARVGQYGDQPANELPPVPDHRPGQVLEHRDELRVVVAQLGIFDHRDRGQQLETRLPEVIGRLMTIQRGLGVLGSPHQLGQRQGEPLDQ